MAEEVDDTGIVYFSRFYRLLPGHDYPPRTGPIGGDLGYLKYGVFVGDNHTFSVTLATPTVDGELRKLLADPVVFDECARQLVATAPWLDGRALPITEEVHVMAGLLNRWRDHVVAGAPVATGVLPVGDAVLCTNPLYGRGCSTAFWSSSPSAIASGVTTSAGRIPKLPWRVTDTREPIDMSRTSATRRSATSSSRPSIWTQLTPRSQSSYAKSWSKRMSILIMRNSVIRRPGSARAH